MRRTDAFGCGSIERRANVFAVFASRFDLAYNAAHALALTALRLCGYRSDKRYLVFQCLVHTADIGKVQVRLFALCHERRNLAEYEGYMDEDPALLAQLLESTAQLLIRVQQQVTGL